MAVIVNLLQGLQAGGMERGTLGQARHMLARGHDVRLLLFDRPYRGASGELDPSPLPCHFIQRQPGFDWQFPLRLASCLEKWRPDILHARNDTALFYAALATKLLASPPGLVATFHSLPAGCGALARRANRWACRQCAFRNAVSGELAQRLVLQGWAREVHTITNGVDIDCFHPAGPSADLRRMLGLSPNTRLIGMIARFDDNKRQQDLLEAFARVRSRCAGTALVFAGDGPTRPRIERQAREIGDVYFISHVSGIAPILRDLDMTVICSQHEGTPRAVLEAMACGKPVVAAAVGGIPSLLAIPGWPAWLRVPPRSPALLAIALERLLASPELRRHLGTLARRRVEDAFSSEREFREYEHLYESVLAAPAGVRAPKSRGNAMRDSPGMG